MSFPLRFSPVTINMPGGVEVPDIPGCFSAGEDLDNAIAMAREAIEGHLELLAQDQQEIPKARLVSVHAANPAYAGCTWALIDISRYLGKAEKLNITLPAYLLTRIDAYVQNHPEHKNRSGFLAEAALRILQGASDRALASNGRRTLTHNSPSFQSDRDL